MSFDIGFSNLNELRDQLIEEFPIINPYSEFKPLPSPKKDEFNKLNGHQFKRIIGNYWKTNSIARASSNLSKRNNYIKEGVVR